MAATKIGKSGGTFTGTAAGSELYEFTAVPTSTVSISGLTSTLNHSGVIATLKLPDWSRAADLPGWLDAFRAWGYVPRVRQLSTGGREVCVVATARPAGRVTPPNRHRATRRPGA